MNVMLNTQKIKSEWLLFNGSPEYRRLERMLSPTQPLFKPLPKSLELILSTLPPSLLLSLLLVSEVREGMMLALLW
jgi:hypothetical protein